jgi:hypothetical protein
VALLNCTVPVYFLPCGELFSLSLLPARRTRIEALNARNSTTTSGVLQGCEFGDRSAEQLRVRILICTFQTRKTTHTIPRRSRRNGSTSLCSPINTHNYNFASQTPNEHYLHSYYPTQLCPADEMRQDPGNRLNSCREWVFGRPERLHDEPVPPGLTSSTSIKTTRIPTNVYIIC